MNELKDTVVIVIENCAIDSCFDVHTIFDKLPNNIIEKIENVDGVKYICFSFYYNYTIGIGKCFDKKKVIDQVKKIILKYNYERGKNENTTPNN